MLNIDKSKIKKITPDLENELVMMVEFTAGNTKKLRFPSIKELDDFKKNYKISERVVIVS